MHFEGIGHRSTHTSGRIGRSTPFFNWYCCVGQAGRWLGGPRGGGKGRLGWPGPDSGCLWGLLGDAKVSIGHACLFDVTVMKHSLGYRSENFPTISDLVSSELRYFTRLAQHLVDFAEVLFFLCNHFPRIFLE
jgi:hypothetical protein